MTERNRHYISVIGLATVALILPLSFEKQYWLVAVLSFASLLMMAVYSHAIRVLVGTGLAVRGGMVLHEVGHWFLVVPFGGQWTHWHWYLTSQQLPERLSPHPWAVATYLYAGGISAFVFASTLLTILVLRRIFRLSDCYWWLFGAIVSAFGFTEFVAGILEGRFTVFYENDIRARLLVLGCFFAGLVMYIMALKTSSFLHFKKREAFLENLWDGPGKPPDK